MSSNLPPTGWVAPADPILLRIPATAVAPNSRIAVFIGGTDWTAAVF
jgi:hypothetical protein